MSRARRLVAAGPADVARHLAAMGWAGDPVAWAAANWQGHIAVDGLDPRAVAELRRAAGRVGVAVAVAGRGPAGPGTAPGAPGAAHAAGEASVLLAATPAQCAALCAALGTGDLASALAALPPPPPPAPAAPPPVRAGPFTLPFGRKTYIVAIVNVTPDSFSEELGRVPGVEETVARVRQVVAEGADIVDIGAESSEARDHGGEAAAEEIRRLLPVLDAVRGLGVPISVDTRRAEVAEAALQAGAHIVNDVDALAGPGMAEVVARHGCPAVVMHSQPDTAYGELMADIAAFLEAAIGRAAAAGLQREQVIVDAGFGFGKTIAQDLEHTRRLGELRALGRPILHAPSRKRTIGRVLGFPETIPERLPGTAAAVALGIAAGADMVRVHDVVDMARVARMADAIVRGWEGAEP